MDQQIRNLLSQLEFGEMQEFKNMAIIPLFNSGDHGPEYISLGEALRKGFLMVTEVTKEGAVPELRVVNKGDIRVLLLDGEELAGAKQNRVLNTTILLKRNSETIIPVSCTEQGRWSYASASFTESGYMAAYRMRNVKLRSVSDSLRERGTYRGNQGAVWNDVRDYLCESGIESSTAAMRDVYDGRMGDLEEYEKYFRYTPNQRGLIVMVNGEIVGLDLLSRESVFEGLFPKLVKSYAMDAMLERRKEARGASADHAKAFLEQAESCAETRFKSVGEGWDHRFENRSVVGSALVYEDRVIHLAFFAAEEARRTGNMSGASRRRSYRLV